MQDALVFKDFGNIFFAAKRMLRWNRRKSKGDEAFRAKPHIHFVQLKEGQKKPHQCDLSSEDKALKILCSAKTLHRKFETNIPKNETARSRSRFLH
jgi:hypothetical protein